ncbi:MAG: ATP-binding cassette domain-containing protein [Spirochaeta sp.]|nr:ATP-binding cassette domain-containing protein [Spirochaeta sp.]
MAPVKSCQNKSQNRGNLLQITDLDVTFEQLRGDVKIETAHALRGIDLTLAPGEVHSLVGESGSGKTVTSTCVIGLLPMPPGKINRGELLFKGRDLLKLSEAEKRKVRGREIAMIFQEPAKYLNPALKVGEQITEMVILHLGMDKIKAKERALDLLEIVGLGRSKRILTSYAHELSGGMKQRVMIAMAISCDPSLLIADEPTTALDVTLQLQILKLILKLKDKLSMSILFISHDLGVVYNISDWISVIYAGKIVESGGREDLFSNPLHPYTRLLFLSIPDAEKRGSRLRAIPGSVPDAEHIPAGCAFHTRCPIAEGICRNEVPLSRSQARTGAHHTAACHLMEKKWPD